MALTLESANKVRQKTYMITRDPVVFFSLKAFFLDWAINHGNADLQLITFSDSTTSTDADAANINTGYSPIGAVTSTVYVLYAKNAGSGDGTDSYISLHNATDNASANYVTGIIQDDKDAFLFISKQGITFGTDLTISAATTAGGATESTAGNGANGFVIIGA